MVKADLHNHLSKDDSVGNGYFNRLVDTTRERLGENAIVGVINRFDTKYEDLICQKGYDREVIERNGSAVYVPEKKIYIVKGQEVTTSQGGLLVLGIPKNVHILEGKSLENTLKESQEKWGIILATNLYNHPNVLNYLLKNSILLEKIDGVETYNGKAEALFPGVLSRYNLNQHSKAFYNFVQKEYSHLGAISSSNGDSFYEIGSSYTELPIPDKNNFKRWLKSSIHQTTLESKRLNRSSMIAATNYFLINNFGTKSD